MRHEKGLSGLMNALQMGAEELSMGYCPTAWRGGQAKCGPFERGVLKMTLRSDGTTQSETCGGPLWLAALSMTQEPIFSDAHLEVGAARLSTLSFQLRFLKAGPLLFSSSL